MLFKCWIWLKGFRSHFQKDSQGHTMHPNLCSYPLFLAIISFKWLMTVHAQTGQTKEWAKPASSSFFMHKLKRQEQTLTWQFHKVSESNRLDSPKFERQISIWQFVYTRASRTGQIMTSVVQMLKLNRWSSDSVDPVCSEQSQPVPVREMCINSTFL